MTVNFGKGGDGIAVAAHRDTPSSPVVAGSLAGLVRALRERALLTQEELAERAQLSVGTVRGLESGRVRRPRSGSLRQLADALGLTGPDRDVLIAAARRERAGADVVLTAASTRPSQLPPAIADFTGREREVARLEQTLLADPADSSPAMAISAVAGPGGVGKTTLAVHVAHRLAGDFPDGHLYVNLQGAQAGPVDVLRALARLLRALGVEESAMPEDLDERAELYRGRIAGRRCLVVLDNAASAAQVRPLLPGDPSCAVLVTSRQRLSDLEGAHHLELDVFAPHQAAALLGKIVGRRRLAAEPDAAHDLARLCGYLPLAVRIAGARMAARSHWLIGQLVERLADERRRLDELVAGDLELRASIGLSYVGLGDDARRAFRLLGLLDAPDFAAWVVAALLDSPVDLATELVDELVAAHLLEVAGIDATGGARYRLHDLIRLYARHRAQDEEPEDEHRAALLRALGAWLALAERAEDRLAIRYFAKTQGDAPRWRPHDDTVGSLLSDPTAWYEAERLALVGAVSQACSLGLDELAWELAASACTFFDRRTFLTDWERTHTDALAACRRAHNARGRAVMARNLANLCVRRVRDWLLPCADEAIAASQEIGDRRLEADARIQWGVLHRRADPSAGRASIEAALALADSVGHTLGAIDGRLWLGVTCHESGDHDAAVRYAETCVELARRHDHPTQQIAALQLLALARREQERYRQGAAACTQALDIARAIGDRREEARLLISLGELYSRSGEAAARAVLERALALSSESEDEFGEAFAFLILGELDLSQGRYEDALAQLRPALEYNRQTEYLQGEARTLRAIGEAHAARSDPDAARSAWDAARQLYELLGDTGEAGRLADRLTELAAESGLPGAHDPPEMPTS